MNIEYRNLDAIGFSGYKVGDDGSVWTCKIMGSASKRGEWKRLRPAMIGPKGKKYPAVSLSNKGTRKTLRVSWIVLTAFVGKMQDGMQACHFPDKSTLNNSLSNLRWGTRSSNESDKKHHGTDNSGTRNTNAKLTEDDVRSIRKSFREGTKQAVLSRQYQVSAHVINCVVLGKTWKHVS